MNGPLPLGLAPRSGESLASYLERLAAAYDVPLGVMLRRVGVHGGGLDGPIGYGTVMPYRIAVELADVLGLRAETLSKMLLTAYVGGAIPAIIDTSDPAAAMKRLCTHWAYLHSSHFCPLCLAENSGAWPLRWRLPWSFACVAHSCLLVDRCPGCGHRPASGGPYSKPPHFIERVPSPGHCSNRQRVDPNGKRPPRRPCGCDLTAVTTVSLRRWPRVMSAQETIDRRIADVSGETAAWFLDLRAVATLLLRYAEPDDLPAVPAPLRHSMQHHLDEREALEATANLQRVRGLRPRRVRVYQTVPQSASLLALILPPALSILQSGSADLIAERLLPIAWRMREQSRSPANVPRAYKISDTLAGAFTVASAQTGSFSLRVGLHASRQREQLGHRIALTARHVPQLLWQEDYEVGFEHMLQPIKETQGRAFCSISLVRLLESNSWERAAELLDLRGAHQSLVYRCQRLLAARRLEDEFRSRLGRLAMEVAGRSPLVDYRSRRHDLSGLLEVPDEMWTAICGELGLRRTQSGGRRRYAAAWMWAESTSGDPFRSPALRHASPAIRQAWSRFRARDLPRMELLLREATGHLVTTDLT